MTALTTQRITETLLGLSDEALASDLEHLFRLLGDPDYELTADDRDALELLCATWIVRISLRRGPRVPLRHLVDEVVALGGASASGEQQEKAIDVSTPLRTRPINCRRRLLTRIRRHP